MKRDAFTCRILNIISAALYDNDPSEPSYAYTSKMAQVILDALRSEGVIEILPFELEETQ